MPWSKVKVETDEPAVTEGGGARRVLPYAEAVREGLSQALSLDPSVFVMGQGVDDPSGMFGATVGLQGAFGPDRVFDTPLAENGLAGICVGAALGGLRPVYLHNRPDFLLLAMDPIVNHAAKWHYMFGGKASPVPLVIWACTGRGWGSAAQHSQALHGLFLHVPGLKVVMPSTCADAKGLLLAAVADPNPVLVLDHRFNFRLRGPVPEEPYEVPLGKGTVRRKGADVTVAAVSHMVTESLRAAEALAAEGIDAEVLDLRSVKPIDEELLLASIARTGRLVVADTAWRTGGLCAEVAAVAAEKGFASLKGPVARVACPDVPTPAGYTLEEAFYPGAAEVASAVRSLLRGGGEGR
jgi:pyruvate dehydrogenase E1 component beta subunit